VVVQKKNFLTHRRGAAAPRLNQALPCERRYRLVRIPAAVLVSPDEFDGWQETIAIRSDQKLMKQIRKGLRALKKKARAYMLDELFQK
jgi:hypothetical protein